MAHLWAAYVVYLFDGEIWASRHCAMPFGARSSVYAWHRVGHLICMIARVMLFLPVGRYVDDYFSVERCAIRPVIRRVVCFMLHYCRVETMEHAMTIFARLVRLLLGRSAIADRKLEFGCNLTVLGMAVKCDWHGMLFTVAPEKVVKWRDQIAAAIESQHLDAGGAQKLAGRLMWACQHLFYRVGRAMVKPIYAQVGTLTGKAGPRLLQALRWWLHVLDHDVSERRDWVLADEAPCYMFVDAASSPARYAAVFVRDGVIEYTDGEPPVSLMCQLKARRDKQIMSLVRRFTFVENL